MKTIAAFERGPLYHFLIRKDRVRGRRASAFLILAIIAGAGTYLLLWRMPYGFWLAVGVNQAISLIPEQLRRMSLQELLKSGMLRDYYMTGHSIKVIAEELELGLRADTNRLSGPFKALAGMTLVLAISGHFDLLMCNLLTIVAIPLFVSMISQGTASGKLPPEMLYQIAKSYAEEPKAKPADPMDWAVPTLIGVLILLAVTAYGARSGQMVLPLMTAPVIGLAVFVWAGVRRSTNIPIRVPLDPYVPIYDQYLAALEEAITGELGPNSPLFP